jgi:putative Ca2+/H+ antiporter (TMEM165/GDT1 family)
MDWKLLWSTFALVFVAELGDKTQLAVFSIALEGGHRWSVFAGAAAALAIASLIAVLAGDLVRHYVPTSYVHRIGGVLLIVVGLWLVLGRAD